MMRRISVSVCDGQENRPGEIMSKKSQFVGEMGSVDPVYFRTFCLSAGTMSIVICPGLPRCLLLLVRLR
eukprot:scaffold43635_cov199-Amphora_coffeaeformis.AAC.4